jgi:hypothetical protein
MSRLFGIGGSAAKTDRNFQFTGWKDLQNLFQFGSKQGKGQVKEGIGGLSDAAKYFKTLMSGDRAAISQLLAPQISSIRGQTSQRQLTNSTFGNRSGGTNAYAQSAVDDATKAIQSLFDSIGPEAAKEFADISGIQESLGINLLDLAKGAASDISGQATSGRSTDATIQQAQQGEILRALFGDFGQQITSG